MMEDYLDLLGEDETYDVVSSEEYEGDKEITKEINNLLMSVSLPNADKSIRSLYSNNEYFPIIEFGDLNIEEEECFTN